jgi:DNA-binding MarR family transcriptional regulator
MTKTAAAPVNPLEMHLGYRLRRASSTAMGDLARRLAQLDLKPTEASVLVLVDANPRISQSRIGQMLGIQRANMAPLVAGLTARGLILREAIDGKSQGLRLTEPGRALTARVLAQMEANEAAFFGGLTGPQRNALQAGLEGLAKALDDA